MKCVFFNLLVITALFSCKQANKPIVSKVLVDSLITHYTTPQAVKDNAADMQFWKNRINPNSPDYSNALKYAATLISRFHLSGDIHDIKTADSVLLKTAADFNGKEAGPYLSLVGHYILQHRFKEADSIFHLATAIGIKKYETAATSFDINFELGRIALAKQDLSTIKSNNDYGYQFRKSKMMHFSGDLDSSISAMRTAAQNAGRDVTLKMAALSNVADLYIHAGQLDKAYDCYMQCIQTNPADMHSIMGIGWIALMNDKNDSLAESIFKFVTTKTQSPDPLFKLVSVAEQRGDSALALQYAHAFEAKASDTIYGNMYNKYLLQLYTGQLQQPAKAEAIGKKELDNRATPQTYAWYAWALLCNNKKDEAYSIYQKYVSGKPLEGLELYWMGKLMRSLDKGYNASQFFKQANKNYYDLDPTIQKDLTKNLE
ncbi:tetratricopeptide repeat protein [Ferruginibacter sp.]